MLKLSSINTDQRLYVIPCGNGYSCYGFDVLDRNARAVAAWLRSHDQGGDLNPAAELGTADHFEQCAVVLSIGQTFSKDSGKRCEVDLIPALIGLEGHRVEVTNGKHVRRFIVGKSTGWMPCHLEIARRTSNGGSPVYWPEGTKLTRVIERVR